MGAWGGNEMEVDVLVDARLEIARPRTESTSSALAADEIKQLNVTLCETERSNLTAWEANRKGVKELADTRLEMVHQVFQLHQTFQLQMTSSVSAIDDIKQLQ